MPYSNQKAIFAQKIESTAQIHILSPDSRFLPLSFISIAMILLWTLILVVRMWCLTSGFLDLRVSESNFTYQHFLKAQQRNFHIPTSWFKALIMAELFFLKSAVISCLFSTCSRFAGSCVTLIFWTVADPAAFFANWKLWSWKPIVLPLTFH